MSITTAVQLDRIRAAYTALSDQIATATFGEWVLTWHVPLNTLIQTLDALLDLTNGQILIGSTSAAPSKATLTAGSSITITNAAGAITIGIANGAIGSDALASGSVTPAKLSDAAKVRHIVSGVLDLSGGAQELFIFKPSQACTITRLALCYVIASDTNTGVTVTIGKPGDTDYYYTGTSEVSIAQYDEGASITPLATDITAGQAVICGTAGGKTGTGKVVVLIEYTTN